MTARLFIAGTDTEVGKTRITTALIHALGERELNVAGVKPVASGCELQDGQLVNADALAIRSAMLNPGDYADTNPVALEPAIAPHIAAAENGVNVNAHGLARHCARVSEEFDMLVVEGAGGWLTPINASETLADVARLLQCRVVLVVGMRLGCINHALLTAQAITDAGLELAGWIANHIDPDMAVADANVETLLARLQAPCLGRIAWQARPDPARIRRELDINPLLP